MSTHYHAFQSRGFAFTIYEPQVEQWHSHFTGFQPEKIARTLNLTFDENYLYLRYMWNNYRLRCRDGVLERQGCLIHNEEFLPLNQAEDEIPSRNSASLSLDSSASENAPTARSGLWTDELFFNEAMTIYHHLAYTVDYPRSPAGRLVPTNTLEGGASANDRRPDPLLTPFSARFSGKTEELAMACEHLQGIKLSQGDVAYEFQPLPQVAVRVIFWDADEDFPAQVQVLADANAVDYMHRETIGCIVSDLLERIQTVADLLTNKALLLRPHHGMCMAFFRGKGYSEEFTAHMTKTLARIQKENPALVINIDTDTLCSHCPFRMEDGSCKTQEKVCRYDREVLNACKIPEGSVIKARSFRKMVQERILNTGIREDICGDCSWSDICR